MKISIVTPSYNRSTFLRQAILSVLTQAGDFEIEYIIQDGGSRDDVIGILQDIDQKLRSGRIPVAANHVEFTWFVEPDSGMYDAINRGFEKATGDVLGWINSDDLYHPGAFQAVSQVFSKFASHNVHWIVGIPNSFNRFGSTSGLDTFPRAYSGRFIREGFYDSEYLRYGFNWIPQDCCFWSRQLWNQAGGLDTTVKYAADFYLWQEFAALTDLVKVYTLLGGYRFHGDQITASPDLYRSELPTRGPVPMAFRLAARAVQICPATRKLIFNHLKGFPLLQIGRLRWRDMVGRTVTWSFLQQDWVISLRGTL